MKPMIHCSATLLIALAIPTILVADQPQLSHCVYFQLKNDTEANRKKLVDACREYLSGHDGIVYFASGVLAEDLSRDVNDTDFDVSLIVVFRDRAAHDKYQSHSRHLEFIERYQELWSGVRVFDSYIPMQRDAEETNSRIPLPDPASWFAGMIRGKVVQKRDEAIVVDVKEVTRQWKHSKASDAQSMNGKRVLMVPGENQQAQRLIKQVQVGETLTVDVAHKRGEALTILELTEQQRQRVK